MKRRSFAVPASALPAVFLVVSVAAYVVSVVYTGSWLPRSPSVHAAEASSKPSVTWRARRLWTHQVGELLVNGNVVIRLRTNVGGYTPTQRIAIVAHRLSGLVDEGLTAGQVHAAAVDGNAVVMGGTEQIVEADAKHAELNRTTPRELAIVWARNVANALGGEPGPAQFEQPAAGGPEAEGAGGPEVEGAAGAETRQPAEQYDTKDVPIISVGRGFRVGMARVAGPRQQVRLVQAVAQIESKLSKYGDVEIYVPISTKVPGDSLERVESCAVVGLADIRL